MKNTAAKMIITVMSLLTIIAILAGLYIHVFSGDNPFGASATASDSVSFDEDVKEILIEVDSAKINVEEGDKLSLEYVLPSGDDPVVNMQDGKLYVTGGRNRTIFSFGHVNEMKVNMKVPKGTKLDRFSVTLDAGKVSAGSIDAGQFILDSDAGDIDIHKVSSDSFELKVDAGNVSINDLTTGMATVKADAGNIQITGSKIDTIDAQVDAGNLEVKDSTVDHGSCKADMGNISLDGEIGDVLTDTGLGNASVNGRKTD